MTTITHLTNKAIAVTGLPENTFNYNVVNGKNHSTLFSSESFICKLPKENWSIRSYNILTNKLILVK